MHQSLLDDGQIVCCSKVGNLTVLYGRRNATFPNHFMVGPHWGRLIFMYTLVMVPTILFINNIAVHWSVGISVFAVFLLCVTLWHFSLAACSNPGVVFAAGSVEPDEIQGCVNKDCLRRRVRSAPCIGSGNEIIVVPVEGDIEATVLDGVPKAARLLLTTPDTTRCELCQVDRPVTATHCYECGVCVDKLDHHCPWTGKCIGKNTKIAFDRFVGCVATLLLFTLLMLVISLMQGHYIFHFSEEERERAQQ